MIRRLTSLLAAIALIFAVAAPPASACESAMAGTSDPADGVVGSMHSMAGAVEMDCPESDEPVNQQPDPDCLATCLSMIGCSAPCFVVVAVLGAIADQESPAPFNTTQSYLTRSSAPDRPPPRI